MLPVKPPASAAAQSSFAARPAAPNSSVSSSPPDCQIDRLHHALALRLVLFSDIHSLHREMSISDGDVLDHAGDFCSEGEAVEARSFGEFLGLRSAQRALHTLAA